VHGHYNCLLTNCLERRLLKNSKIFIIFHIIDTSIKFYAVYDCYMIVIWIAIWKQHYTVDC